MKTKDHRDEVSGRFCRISGTLAEKAGVPKGKFANFAIDRARLHKAKGNAAAFNVAVRLLKARKDLTDEQWEEVRRMGEK